MHMSCTAGSRRGVQSSRASDEFGSHLTSTWAPFRAERRRAGRALASLLRLYYRLRRFRPGRRGGRGALDRREKTSSASESRPAARPALLRARPRLERRRPGRTGIRWRRAAWEYGRPGPPCNYSALLVVLAAAAQNPQHAPGGSRSALPFAYRPTWSSAGEAGALGDPALGCGRGATPRTLAPAEPGLNGHLAEAARAGEPAARASAACKGDFVAARAGTARMAAITGIPAASLSIRWPICSARAAGGRSTACVWRRHHADQLTAGDLHDASSVTLPWRPDGSAGRSRASLARRPHVLGLGGGHLAASPGRFST